MGWATWAFLEETAAAFSSAVCRNATPVNLLTQMMDSSGVAMEVSEDLDRTWVRRESGLAMAAMAAT